MKRRVILVFSLLLTVLLFSGCGGQTKEEAEDEISSYAYYVQTRLENEIHNPILNNKIVDSSKTKIDMDKVESLLEDIQIKNNENIKELKNKKYNEEWKTKDGKSFNDLKEAAIEKMMASGEVLKDIIKRTKSGVVVGARGFVDISDEKNSAAYRYIAQEYSPGVFFNSQYFSRTNFNFDSLLNGEQNVFTTPLKGEYVYGNKIKCADDVNLGLAIIDYGNYWSYGIERYYVVTVLHNFGPKPLSLFGVNFTLYMGSGTLYSNDPMQYDPYLDQLYLIHNIYNTKVTLNPGEQQILVRTFNRNGSKYENLEDGHITLRGIDDKPIAIYNVYRKWSGLIGK